MSVLIRDVLILISDKAYWEAYKVVPLIIISYVVFSFQYYFNMGIYFQTEGRVNFPRDFDCHLRLRVEQLLVSKEEIESFYSLSDFESCSNSNERIEELTKIIIDKAIPWFREFNSLSDVKNSSEVVSTMYWNNGEEILNKAM